MAYGEHGFVDSQRVARQQRDSFKDFKSSETPDRMSVLVDSEIYNYIFQLQIAREKTGRMDHRQFAEKMWEELLGGNTEDETFKQFEADLVTGLHAIDMREHVYPHVKESLADLVSHYGEHAQRIALWTTGDVVGTGYQVAKIERSEIIRRFYEALLEKMKIPTSKKQEDRMAAKKLMREKTTYIVDDNKFEAMKHYISEFQKANHGEPMKIVVIEDSVKNFAKVRDIFSQFPGVDIQLVPIWATYSREGKNAEKKANEARKNGDEKISVDLDRQKVELNAISSFADLLDQDRFGEYLKDAHIFVDFDGVIGNNITMREDQASVIYSSFVAAAKKATGKSAGEVKEMVSVKLSGKKD